jgi:hypothetical protein
MTALELRTKYSTFTYSSYSWELSSNNSLVVVFNYHISSPNQETEVIYFSPKVEIHNVTQEMVDLLGKDSIDTYVFHTGMSELFSYWKTTASPKIYIEAGFLSQEELGFWHTLLINGMGEFFFQNQIDFSAPDFVTFASNSKKKHLTTKSVEPNGANSSRPKVLIPIGGGKDSSVTLEILKQHFEVGSYEVSAPEAARDTVSAAAVKPENQLKITRTLDKKMLELNKQGYLNGHVPISAFLAFLSVFTADLFGFTHIAISNERSSNEGNTWYCDKEINHQYSKTYEFESNFQKYVKNSLPEQAPFYFSFLRPLYELQIGKLFASMPQYHNIFRSCNRGQKENIWCGECSKCLFAWTIIFPFVGEDKMAEYFGKNLFTDENLWETTKELLGIADTKPFECVGTHEETIAAFHLSIKQYEGSQLPALLEKISQELQSNQQLQAGPTGESDLDKRTESILQAWNSENSLPVEFEAVLKNALSKS